jgi:hypothetical protein
MNGPKGYQTTISTFLLDPPPSHATDSCNQIDWDSEKESLGRPKKNYHCLARMHVTYCQGSITTRLVTFLGGDVMAAMDKTNTQKSNR